MKKCSGCGAPLEDDSLFCTHCGQRVTEEKTQKNICPYCGVNNAQDARFCVGCGQSLRKIQSAGKGSESEKSYSILTGILLVLICGAIGFGGTMLYRSKIASKDQEGSVVIKELQDELEDTESDQEAQEKAEKRKKKREERKIARQEQEAEEEAQMEEENEEHKFHTKSPENEAFVIPDSDTRRLSRQDLTGLSKYELLYARNEIYARHGRRFDMELLQDYFDSKSWYHGTVDADHFSRDVLSDTEKANAAFIREYEKEKGYNSW